MRKNKKSNNSGETIAETLVALLISSLGLMMLAGMLTTSSKLITESKAKFERYYAGNKALEQGTWKEGTDHKANVTIERYSETIPVTYYINNEFSDDPVIAFYAK